MSAGLILPHHHHCQGLDSTQTAQGCPLIKLQEGAPALSQPVSLTDWLHGQIRSGDPHPMPCLCVHFRAWKTDSHKSQGQNPCPKPPALSVCGGQGRWEPLTH